MKNSGDNVFAGIPVGAEEADLSAASSPVTTSRRTPGEPSARPAKVCPVVRNANREPFTSAGHVRDVTDFRDHLRRDQRQAVATVNRCLVTLRRFFGWLVRHGHVQANPAKQVKELRRQLFARKDWSGRTFAGCCGKSSFGRT